MAKLLIFDWDGTLCDSLSRIALCIRCAAEEIGLPPPPEHEAREIVGLGLVDALERLFPGIHMDQILAMRDSYSRHFVQHDSNPSPFFEGVQETLDALKDEGYLLAVATGKSRRGLNRVFESRKLNNFFHGSRCADETAGKPNPLMIHELLDDFGVPAKDALMIGDTEFDMEMAVNAGTPRIAVSYGAHSADRLKKYQPLACVDDFFEIRNIIKNNILNI